MSKAEESVKDIEKESGEDVALLTGKQRRILH